MRNPLFPLAMALLLSCSLLQAQLPYIERFETNGEGITGPCGATPETCATANIPAATGWTIVGNTSGMIDASDYFRVENEMLEAVDLGGQLCFVSPKISIEDADSVDVSVLFEEVGTHEESDYVDFTYIIDDESFLVTNWMGFGSDEHTLTGDYGSTVVTLEDLMGDSIQIEICVLNNSGLEKTRIDDLFIFGPAPNVRINELDSDQGGTDTTEFIELLGPADQSLFNFVLVLFNGANGESYEAMDLDSDSTNGSGFFVVCFGANEEAYCDRLVPAENIQNGIEGVGLYYGFDDSDFENGTILTDENLVDGLIYQGGADGDTVDLSILATDCDPECLIDEDLHGEFEVHSIQRGSWFVSIPTPGVDNVPLPVELLDFRAESAGHHVVLSWTTASGTHNAYFEIEYSRDGRTWTRLARKAGAHNSHVSHHYTYTHVDTGEGMHYYRLRQVDEDGGWTLSGVRVVDMRRSGNVAMSTIVTTTLTISWDRPVEADVSLMSIAGRTLDRMSVKNENSVVRSVEGLPPGVYIVHIAYADHADVLRIVKQ